ASVAAILSEAAPLAHPTAGLDKASSNAPRETSATMVPPRSIWAWFRLPMRLLAERRFAHQRSHELLKLYGLAHDSAPHLSGKELYLRVVIQAGYDPKAAQSALLRAEQSYCQWPAEHDLSFSDVVRYLLVTEYLRSHVESLGTESNM